MINSYWYGELSVSEGVTTVGGIVGDINTDESKPTIVTDCYYGIKGSEELTDLSDPFDENGATELPGYCF